MTRPDQTRPDQPYCPLVSVIVPIYNVEKYLPACIDSLINQTLQNIEIILVNDASPDGCLAIMRDYEARYPEKIIVIDSKENLRQGGARNLGIRQALGEYIGFVDGDDFVHPDMYRTLYEAMSTSDADFASIQITSVDEDAVIEDRDKFTQPYIEWGRELREIENTELTDEGRNTLIVHSTGGVYSKLYRRDWLLSSKLFFPEHLAYEDNYWFVMMCICVRKFILIEKVMYCYRQHTKSTVNAEGIHHLDRIPIGENVVNDLKARGLLERYYSSVEYFSTIIYFVNTFGFLTSRMSPIRWDAVYHIRDFMKENFPDFLNNKYLKQKNCRFKIKVILISISPKLYYYMARIYKAVKAAIKTPE